MATPIFLSKTVFSYSFRTVLKSYRFYPFQTPFEENNGVFHYSQSQAIDKKRRLAFQTVPFTVYFINQSTTFARKTFETGNRLTNEQQGKLFRNILSQ